MHTRHRLSFASRQHQTGIATILIILLTGLSLTAVVLGLNHYLRIGQQQGLALQAQTQSQIKAWTGAEIVRRYLDVLLKNEDEGIEPNLTLLAQSLKNGDPLPLTGIPGLSARVVALDADQHEYTIDIFSLSAEGTRAQSSATLRLVYRIATEESGTNNHALDFNRDLRLGGDIKIISDDGKKYDINVQGNLSTSGNSITGVSTIRTTGSIEIGSGSSFDELHANGDIKLTGSVSGQQNLSALGNICLSGGASAMGLVRANGSVTGDGGVQFGRISSLAASERMGDPLCGDIALDKDGKPYGVDLQGNASAQKVATKGSVRLSSGSIGSLAAEGHFVATNGGSKAAGWAGGDVENQAGSGGVDVLERPGQRASTSKVIPIVIASDTFDARTLENEANFVFRVDEEGYKKVLVRNIADIEDGEYYIGDYENDNGLIGQARGYKDYLCTSLAEHSQPGNATTPGKAICAPDAGVLDPPGTLCKGHSSYNSCMDAQYQPATQTEPGYWRWSLNGTTFAPGIAWFEGDLHVGVGTYYNTFIATRNIDTGGSITVYAPSYAGPTGEANGKRYSPQGICNNTDFPGRQPTQFCKADGSFDYTASRNAGQFALMAGSCPVDGGEDCSPYIGGDIKAGASNTIYGSIRAGNAFSSGGSTVVHGYVAGLGLGTESLHDMGGSTTINLRELPPGFDPAAPDPENTSVTTRHIQVRWSRYL